MIGGSVGSTTGFMDWDRLGAFSARETTSSIAAGLLWRVKVPVLSL